MNGNGILLVGLDGSNPLAFLAALGTLRVLSIALPEDRICLSWEISRGTWAPRVHCNLDQQTLIDTLFDQLKPTASDHDALAWRIILSGDIDLIRKTFCEALKDSAIGRRTYSDWLVTAGSDALLPDKDGIPDGGFRCSRSDYFAGNIEKIVETTTKNHLRRSLVLPWDYADPSANLSLRFDPRDGKRYAHQWKEPTSDPDRHAMGNMLGANRLALEALVCFPSFVASNELLTTALRGRTSKDTFFTWPIWRTAINLDIARSLCASAILQEEYLDHQTLRAISCEAVFRCQRLTIDKNKCLSPARQI